MWEMLASELEGTAALWRHWTSANLPMSGELEFISRCCDLQLGARLLIILVVGLSLPFPLGPIARGTISGILGVMLIVELILVLTARF
jgi:hypothetical protein